MHFTRSELKAVILVQRADLVQCREAVTELLAINAQQRQQIAELLAGDAATLEKATAVFQKSEDVEAKARGFVDARP